MTTKIEFVDLPEPSGDPRLHNELDIYLVGDNEFEEPELDYEYALQFLSDAIEARRLHQEIFWDELAKFASSDPAIEKAETGDWNAISEEGRDLWREYVRGIIEFARTLPKRRG